MTRLSIETFRPVFPRSALISTVLRIALGLIYTLAGVNGFFLYAGLEPFLSKSPAAIELLGTGYLLVLEKSAELAGGLLLLSGRFIPLALLALFPITLNIAAFHLFVDPALLLPVLAMFLAHGYMLWAARRHYASLLCP
ncbi:DoxX protein [Paenibacillus sp. UNCCL117]|uniref:DoxX family membrane protein n=1 Tax=unclassified Paenibacillus TaxID=185978 RepID=UPI0008806AC4|nr:MULTISPECIES: DoxX family membrane protein [unclassified Paenibacillus]SDD12983.1 DoxX protein [Paenibacillus sp. cl123]SFW33895.1 DoxX protein [Paenibacillus sp. UNCCL117]